MSQKKLDHIVVRSSGFVQGVREVMVHYRSVPRQGGARTLCSWDGGIPAGETDDPVTCTECLAIMRFFRPKSVWT